MQSVVRNNFHMLVAGGEENDYIVVRTQDSPSFSRPTASYINDRDHNEPILHESHVNQVASFSVLKFVIGDNLKTWILGGASLRGLGQELTRAKVSSRALVAFPPRIIHFR